MGKKTIVLVASFIILLGLYFYSQTGIQRHTHELTRNGFALHLVSYEDPRAEPTSPYPDILLIHGLTYSSSQFDLNIHDYSLARFLAQQGFRVWLLDITGYGQSEKPQNGFQVNTAYAAEDINAAVNYILKLENTDKINLLGWSWGTQTTSQFAAKHPAKVNKLILYAPIMHGLTLAAPQSGYQAFNIDDAKNDFNPQQTEPDVLRAYLTQVQQHDSLGSPNGGRKDLFQGKKVELIPYHQLKVPTLFIAGDKDPYLSAEQDLTQMMKYAFKQSCAIIFHGAGHALFLEKDYYRKFQISIAEFLKMDVCKDPRSWQS